MGEQQAKTPALPALPPQTESEGANTAMGAYLAQLQKYAPIPREEEHALALRWAKGDREAGRALVLANLRFVVKIALEYKRAWANTLDLIQEGNLGLVEAVQRFDPQQNAKLSSYAAYWIRAYILQYLLANMRMVKLGQTRAQRKLFYRLNRERRELERQGFKAEPRLLAERLDVDEAEVREMQSRLNQQDLSLDAPARGDDGESGATVGDFFAAPETSQEEIIADANLQRVFNAHVKEFAAALGARERRVLEARILADAGAQLTLNALGEEMGVTRERIRQIEAKLMKDLREYMRENFADFDAHAAAGV